MSTGPALSIVVVSPHDFAHVRRTVRHLREQDDADQLELVLVATTEAAVADARPSELVGFAATRTVAVGAIPNVDRAAARGVLAASADLVAVIEDHAYVAPGWVRAVLAAYRDAPWVSVGSVMENANPDSSLSWANLVLGYGWWIDPAAAGEMRDVPSHNGSYRRAALAAFGEELPDLMVRGGGLHDRLRADGGRMFLAADARIAHVNPSTLPATADLRVNAGRLYGDERRRQERWPAAKRVLYAVAAPLIPAVRFRRIRAEHLAPGREHARLFPRALPGMIAALVLDAAGQALGYLRGAGRAPEVLAVFEMDRMQHLRRRDRERLAEAVPAR
ncbi:hypothetical protein [Modestobacter sp. VKM Ac-2985]|uniref:hypothetical protein n=1 Tax=Modestobacter sp. VKM Ac-2985 TaxID=3004139 RepID=UPI0022AB893B|nr:hypothetical protein [Modestobacter sp. VKM Ac-2985]MCZ2837702.1 hypothetical protein [Modestobacter sp. VKM Ac-2985]